ncbi:MAG: acylneuraminate cytidylyltransferase [Rhizobiaceae bacterium]|nr:acylneuraminate cytidylyltransferase [Rhizobiaceae bacterium]
MKTIAVIPARGGSVGLPRKNVRPLNGIPLVGRAVLAALAAEGVDTVYVSSDSDEILKVAAEHGAVPIRRPEGISGAQASSESALLHALDEVEAAGETAARLVFLQCTSPFTTGRHIDAVLDRLSQSGAAAAFSAVEDHGFIWSTAEDGTAQGITHDHTEPRQRRQDIAPRYRENGAIYAMRVDDFRRVGNRFCGPTVLVPVDAPPIEIDSPQDWAVAEAYATIDDPLARPRSPGRKIRALVTDFDGVHTDDRVVVDEEGRETVRCSRSDGMGIEHLRNRGLKLLILSREQNPVVRARAAKLRMAVMHHIFDKLGALDQWRKDHGLDWDELAYVGNDVNDLDCMRAVGLSFAPGDAHPAAREEADIVLARPGGRGALRELSEFLLKNDLVA